MGLTDRDMTDLHAFAVRADLPAFKVSIDRGHRSVSLDFGDVLGIDGGVAVWIVDRQWGRVVACTFNDELAGGDTMADVLLALSKRLPRRVEVIA
jgi:hypothetical protein